jgi:hypothetical protein
MCLAVTLVGCSGFIERRAASTTYGILAKSTEVAKRQSDLELARAALPGGILQLATFALAYPDHRGFRTLHADAVCQYAVAFIFDDWEDAKLRGRDAEAEQITARLGSLLSSCVESNIALLPPAWQKARAQGPDAMIALLPSATKDDVPMLLWIANTDIVRLAIAPLNHLGQLPAIKATLARCAQLAPGYREAEAELMLATLTAALSMLPGNSDGEAEFLRARTRAGEGALMVDVMFARGTAVARRDRALFDTTLNRVLEADLNRWPDRRLANELARRKARRYLAAVNALIP